MKPTSVLLALQKWKGKHSNRDKSITWIWPDKLKTVIINMSAITNKNLVNSQQCVKYGDFT